MKGNVSKPSDGAQNTSSVKSWLDAEGTFRAAFDCAPVGMAILALDGQYLKVNRNWCALLDHNEHTALPRHFQDIVHSADRAVCAAAFERLASGNESSSHLELRCLRQDGEATCVRLGVATVCGADRRPAYFVCQLEDLTACKRVVAALKLNQEYCRPRMHTSTGIIIERENDEPLEAAPTRLSGTAREPRTYDWQGSTPGTEGSAVMTRMRRLSTELNRIATELAEISITAIATDSIRPEALTDLHKLSPKELEVLRGLMANHRVSSIARSLCLSPHTVRNHLSSIFRKLGVSSQAELLDRILRLEAIDRPSSPEDT